MTITVSAVRARMTAVAAAPPWQRRARMRELMTAGVALTELVASYDAWLKQESAWLDDDDTQRDPAFATRETRYLACIPMYQEAVDVLGEVLLMVKRDTDGVTAGTIAERAEQGALL